MNKFLQRVLPLLSLVVLLVNCRKQEWDAIYGRPDTLEPPIYQQLQAKGNFKSLLAAIDKAGYKQILGAAGYWTFFAPHDSAFQVYFKEKNVSGIEQLDSADCRKIVTYSLVYNAFKKDRIDDYQSTTGWVTNQAFKRRTAAYTGVYEGSDNTGNTLKVIASNRNNTNGTNFFVDADNNNKYIPIFADGYMTGKALTAADYNYFYPNTTYTGFNVADAVVTESDIAAENGVIHVVNKVITTLPSLDEYLGSNPNYSEFRRLFDKFLVTYALNASVTQKYQQLNPNASQVFTKVFASALAFSPNNENFMKLMDNDGQANTYSMFAPTNDVLKNYIDNVLLENFPSKRIEDLPINIIYDFINAHLWQTAVWPSKFQTTFNYLGEEARFNAADVVDKKILSNGIFYGTNKVQEANVFSSVFGKAYLNPQYSMMTSLLNQELKFTISNVRQKYTLFLVSNKALNDSGYFVDPLASNLPNEQWRYTPPGGGTELKGNNAIVRLLRMLNMHVVQGDLTSMSGSSAAQTFGGEFITYNNNKVQGAGNAEYNAPANVDSVKTAKNGTVYYLNRPLNYSNLAIGTYLRRLGSATTSEYNYFWRYLISTDLYNTSNDEFNAGPSTGSFYTFFVPKKSAIEDAIRAGLLPGTVSGTTVTPKTTGYTTSDIVKVKNFILYHILNKKSVATDGQDSGSFETLFKTKTGDATSIFVTNNTGNSMRLTDMNDRTADVIMGNTTSNQLGNRIVIHLINNYLKYTE
jgi:uncharacterized surface protein with fasciclin (FAS1) repeats